MNDYVSVTGDANQVYLVTDGLMIHRSAAEAFAARQSGGGSYVNISQALFNQMVTHFTVLPNVG